MRARLKKKLERAKLEDELAQTYTALYALGDETNHRRRELKMKLKEIKRLPLNKLKEKRARTTTSPTD
jgi:hypothetical protein